MSKNGNVRVKLTLQNLHPDLVDVALIDAATCAAPGSMGVSWWLAQVAAGIAPQPVVRKHLCTRWRLGDVRSFWVSFAEGGATDTAGTEKLMASVKKASAASKSKRAQLAQAGA